VDWSLLHSLNNFMAGHDGVEDVLLFYVEASEALFVATLFLVFVFARGPGRQLGKLISELVDRARPFVADPHGVHLFTPHAADPGFPSDHATAAFAIAVAILLRRRGWGIAALVAATVLAIGRVALGVHYPSDVLAGAALGAAAALALWWAPLRSRVDALADLLGRPVDQLFAAASRRLRSQ
jgi:undecaprenyl-diphosphatase